MKFKVEDSTGDKHLGKIFFIQNPVIGNMYKVSMLSNKSLKLVWLNETHAKFQNSHVTYICDIVSSVE